MLRCWISRREKRDNRRNERDGLWNRADKDWELKLE